MTGGVRERPEKRAGSRSLKKKAGEKRYLPLLVNTFEYYPQN